MKREPEGPLARPGVKRAAWAVGVVVAISLLFGGVVALQGENPAQLRQFIGQQVGVSRT